MTAHEDAGAEVGWQSGVIFSIRGREEEGMSLSRAQAKWRRCLGESGDRGMRAFLWFYPLPAPTSAPFILSAGRKGGSSGTTGVREGCWEEVASEGKFNWMSASPLECHFSLSDFRVFCGSVTQGLIPI